MSIAEKIATYIKEKREFSLKELYEEFSNVKKHTIRARLYESEYYKKKKIIRTQRGVYALVGAEIEAIVEKVDTKEHVYKLTNAKMTYDLVIIDPPYKTSAQKGGNRDLAGFPMISPEEFKNIVFEVEKLLKDDYSQVVMMISGGESGKGEVERYLRVFEQTELKLAKKGFYRKYNKNGTVCNMGRYPMPDEQILFYSRSGKERPDIQKDEEPEYHFCRPPLKQNGGYPTQKPIGMLEKIIERTTKEGDRILDLFLGSGASITAALGLKRKIHGLEISQTAIREHIIPRMLKFQFLGRSKQTTIFDFI